MKNIDEMIVYNVTDSAIAKMREECLVLQVKGIDDAEGYEIVKRAHIEVKAKRAEVENKRKELKADSIEFGRKVDAEAKRISSKLAEIELYLQMQRDVIDNEKKRIKQEEEQALQRETERRVSIMQGYRATFGLSHLALMSKEEFENLAAGAKVAFENAEKVRIENDNKLKELQEQQAESNRRHQAQEEENRRLNRELQERQQREIKEKEAQLQKERDERAAADRQRAEDQRAEQAKREEEDRQRKAAEDKRVADENAAKEKAENERKEREAEAAKKIADEKLLSIIKSKFPTLESAWVEIARLTKKNKQEGTL